MRKILFRGKRISNGGWVYGGIVSSPHPNYDHPMVYAICSNKMDVFVDQESIGQYTGLTDKNGKKIFEGDIVWCIRSGLDGANMVGHIIYDDCCFCVKERTSLNCPAMDLCGDFEVIGNIHDNPELLEGGAS